MYEDVRIDFYIPLFHGLLFAVFSYFTYTIIYLRQKKRDAAEKESRE